MVSRLLQESPSQFTHSHRLPTLFLFFVDIKAPSEKARWVNIQRTADTCMLLLYGHLTPLLDCEKIALVIIVSCSVCIKFQAKIKCRTLLVINLQDFYIIYSTSFYSPFAMYFMLPFKFQKCWILLFLLVLYTEAWR